MYICRPCTNPLAYARMSYRHMKNRSRGHCVVRMGSHVAGSWALHIAGNWALQVAGNTIGFHAYTLYVCNSQNRHRTANQWQPSCGVTSISSSSPNNSWMDSDASSLGVNKISGFPSTSYSYSLEARMTTRHAHKQQSKILVAILGHVTPVPTGQSSCSLFPASW